MSLSEIYQSYTNNFSLYSMDDVAVEYMSSPPFSQMEELEFPDISSSIQSLEAIFSDEHMDTEFPVHVDELLASSVTDNFSLTDDLQMDFDELDSIFNADDGDMTKLLDRPEETSGECYHMQQSPSDGSYESNPDLVWGTSTGMASLASSLVLPFEGMEVDNQLSFNHLLMAYAEALGNQETKLSMVVGQSIIHKVNPVNGGAVGRVLYYMFQHLNRKPNYLIQESINNFYPAFKLFYQMFPYGKFVHSVANSTIQEALPKDAEVIVLIDFDIGEGIQWATLMDAIKHDHNKEIRLISVKLNEEDKSSPSPWRFEETKRRLSDHAGLCQRVFKIEEVRLQDLEGMIKNIQVGYHGRKSWHVFNCNVWLPHMGRVRRRGDVSDFLRVAQNFLHNTNKGIIIYGHGDAWDSAVTSTSCSSFLDGTIKHYQTLLESMECTFPRHLGEARTALECLFVAPYASSAALGGMWEERMQCGDVKFGMGLKGWRLSGASLAEAKEHVRGGVIPYEVSVEGEKKNAVVLRWKGAPMVRVSCWQS